MIEFPSRGLAGTNRILSLLDDVFEAHPVFRELQTPLHVRGHSPGVVGAHIVIGPMPGANEHLAPYIQRQCGHRTLVGPVNGIDGDGLTNWISFSKEVRTGDPRTVARTCLLTLFQLHNLITWT